VVQQLARDRLAELAEGGGSGLVHAPMLPPARVN